MVDNPVWAISERVAEVQALLDNHLAGGKHSAADVIAKAQAVLSESELLRAMFVVGYFSPNTPPPDRSVLINANGKYPPLPAAAVITARWRRTKRP